MIRPLPNNLYFGQMADEGWAYIGNSFTPQECAEIIDVCTSGEFTGKLVPGGIHIPGHSHTVLDTSVRRSDICWLDHEVDKTKWIFERIITGIKEVNNNLFNFDIENIESIQFSRYSGDNGRYGKHVDAKISVEPVRKLSISIQLSKSDDYVGGDLLLYTKESPDSMPKDHGMMVVFPSFMLHEVTPVTAGTRYSLVAWISGPKFK